MSEAKSDVDLIAEHHDFPGIFPIKIFVRHDPELEQRLRDHLDEIITNAQVCEIQQKVSKKGNFTALTIMAFVDSADHLREVYAHLKKRPEVLMAL